jgi:hypothetical protein
MGLPEDLPAVQDLHEKVNFTDQEFADAKAATPIAPACRPAATDLDCVFPGKTRGSVLDQYNFSNRILKPTGVLAVSTTFPVTFQVLRPLHADRGSGVGALLWLGLAAIFFVLGRRYRNYAIDSGYLERGQERWAEGSLVDRHGRKVHGWETSEPGVHWTNGYRVQPLEIKGCSGCLSACVLFFLRMCGLVCILVAVLVFPWP